MSKIINVFHNVVIKLCSKVRDSKMKATERDVFKRQTRTQKAAIKRQIRKTNTTQKIRIKTNSKTLERNESIRY